MAGPMGTESGGAPPAVPSMAAGGYAGQIAGAAGGNYPAGGYPAPAPYPYVYPYPPGPAGAPAAYPSVPAQPAAPVWGGLGSRPLFGIQTGLVQVRQPAFWLYVGLLVIAGILTLSEQAQVISALPTAYFVSWVLLALWVVPVVLAIYLLDIFEREPLSLLAAAFVWGAVVATALAEPTNTAMFEVVFKLFGANTVQQWGAAVSGPPIEETLKYCGIVLIYLIARNEIDDLFDGFIYGALIGLGFATVENVQYFIRAAAGAGAGGNEIGAVFNLYLLRVIFSGPYMHVLWTGLSGIGLAYAVTRTDLPRQRRILGAAGMFAAGVSAHFLWNSPFLNSLLAGNPGPLQMILFGLIKGLPFLGFLVILVYLSQRREARWFEGAVAGEVQTGVLTADDVADITDLRRRWSSRRQANTLYGPAAAKLVARLQQEETTLAMIRARVTEENAPDLVRQRDVIRDLKAQLATARATPRPARSVAAPPQPVPQAAYGAATMPGMFEMPAPGTMPPMPAGAMPPSGQPGAPMPAGAMLPGAPQSGQAVVAGPVTTPAPDHTPPPQELPRRVPCRPLASRSRPFRPRLRHSRPRRSPPNVHRPPGCPPTWCPTRARSRGRCPTRGIPLSRPCRLTPNCRSSSRRAAGTGSLPPTAGSAGWTGANCSSAATRRPEVPHDHVAGSGTDPRGPHGASRRGSPPA